MPSPAPRRILPQAARLALVLSVVSLSGCFHIWANKNVAPTFKDQGADLPGNPYDHLAAPEYTRGRISGFRELFVEPDPFADKVAPKEPLPPVASTPTETLSLPPGLTPALVAKARLDLLNEGHTFEDLTAKIAESHDGSVVAMPTAGLIVLRAPEARAAQTALIRQVGARKVAGHEVSKLAELSVADALPEALTQGEVLPAEPGARVVTVAPLPPPPPPPPATGVLPLDNMTTSYLEVTLNGDKVGVVPPLAEARIHEVKSGVYEVGYLLPNGFAWTERIATRNDLGPRVRIEADRILFTEPIFFETDAASIQVRSFALVDDIADALREHPEIKKVRIEGHTDSDGTAAYNLDLSAMRAAAVADALVARGVERGRLTTEGYGELRPVASNGTAEGKAMNRRVEFHIVEKTGE